MLVLLLGAVKYVEKWGRPWETICNGSTGNVERDVEDNREMRFKDFPQGVS